MQVPVYFAEDLFSLLGDAKRPDYRWLIMVRSATNQEVNFGKTYYLLL